MIRVKKNKQFLVAGLGRFGRSCALTFQGMGYDVLAVDEDESTVQALSDKLTYVICADASDINTLKTMDLENIDVAVVSIGSLEGSLLCTMLLKELGVPMVVAKALSEVHGAMLSKIGADKVIYAERDMGERVAHNLVSNSIMDYIELSSEVSVMNLHVNDSLIGKNLIEADLRNKYDVNVVAIRRSGRVMVNPKPQEVFQKGDEFVVIGTHDGVKKMGVEF